MEGEMDFARIYEKNIVQIPLGFAGEYHKVEVPTFALGSMLVCGNTGSGKSCFLHTIISTLLYEKKNVEFTLMDTKQIEFDIYKRNRNVKIVRNGKDFVKQIEKALKDIYERYKIFVSYKKRNIEEYNIDRKYQMPYKIIIIDELADIVYDKEMVDNLKCILAKGKAAGVYVYAATQNLPYTKRNLNPELFYSKIVVSNISDENSSLHKLLIYHNAPRDISKDELVFINPLVAEKPIKLKRLYYNPKFGLASVILNKPIGQVTKNDFQKIQHFSNGEFVPVRNIDKIEKKKIVKKEFEVPVNKLEEVKDIFSRISKENINVLKYALEKVEYITITFFQRHLQIGYVPAAKIVDYLEEENIISKKDETSKTRTVLDRKRLIEVMNFE